MTESELSKAILRKDTESVSYKYHYCVVQPKSVFMDCYLFWNIVDYETNQQMMYCPFLNWAKSGKIGEFDCVELFSLLPQSQCNDENYKGPTTFVINTWKGEEEPVKERELNHLHHDYELMCHILRSKIEQRTTEKELLNVHNY